MSGNSSPLELEAYSRQSDDNFIYVDRPESPTEGEVEEVVDTIQLQDPFHEIPDMDGERVEFFTDAEEDNGNHGNGNHSDCDGNHGNNNPTRYSIARATFLKHSSVSQEEITRVSRCFAPSEGPMLTACLQVLEGSEVRVDEERFPFFLKFSLLLRIARFYEFLVKWASSKTKSLSFLTLWRWSKLALICNPKALKLRKIARLKFSQSALLPTDDIDNSEGEICKAGFEDLDLLMFLLDDQFIWWTMGMLGPKVDTLARASNVATIILRNQSSLISTIAHSDYFVSVFWPTVMKKMGDHGLSEGVFRFQMSLVEYQRHRLTPSQWPEEVRPHPQQEAMLLSKGDVMMQLQSFYRPVVWLEMMIKWTAVTKRKEQPRLNFSLDELTRRVSRGYMKDICQSLLSTTGTMNNQQALTMRFTGGFLDKSVKLTDHDRTVLSLGLPVHLPKVGCGNTLVLHLVEGTPCFYPQEGGETCHWWLQVDGVFVSFYTSTYREVTTALQMCEAAYLSYFYRN
eukprot:sb/3463944/